LKNFQKPLDNKGFCVIIITERKERNKKMKLYNFLFEDEDGEMFFVQCADELKCEPILRENGFDPDKVVLVDVLDDEEAEMLGYDTY
jgi:hypothetical protein